MALETPAVGKVAEHTRVHWALGPRPQARSPPSQPGRGPRLLRWPGLSRPAVGTGGGEVWAESPRPSPEVSERPLGHRSRAGLCAGHRRRCQEGWGLTHPHPTQVSPVRGGACQGSWWHHVPWVSAQAPAAGQSPHDPSGCPSPASVSAPVRWSPLPGRLLPRSPRTEATPGPPAL